MKKTRNGDGIIDIIKSAFVESKFPGEMNMPGTSYTGPGTRLDIRTSGYPDYMPDGDVGQSVSKFDNISREHDIVYDKIKHDYLEHGSGTAGWGANAPRTVGTLEVPERGPV